MGRARPSIYRPQQGRRRRRGSAGGCSSAATPSRCPTPLPLFQLLLLPLQQYLRLPATAAFQSWCESKGDLIARSPGAGSGHLLREPDTVSHSR